MNTDTELLRCYVEEKSESAFTELVRHYVGLVYSVALRRLGGDAHLAEDVTQGTVLTTAASTAVPTGLGAKVASHALTTAGTSGGGALLGGWLAPALPAAAVLVLGGLALDQYRANNALRDELGRSAIDRAALASLKTENRELTRKLAHVGALRTTAAVPLPELPRSTTIAVPRPARPIAASIIVTAEGGLRWNSDFVSLAEFISRLRTAGPSSCPCTRSASLPGNWVPGNRY